MVHEFSHGLVWPLHRPGGEDAVECTDQGARDDRGVGDFVVVVRQILVGEGGDTREHLVVESGVNDAKARRLEIELKAHEYGFVGGVDAAGHGPERAQAPLEAGLARVHVGNDLVEVAHPAPRPLEHEISLGREVAVHGASRRASRSSDVVHRDCVEAAISEQTYGGFCDLGAELLVSSLRECGHAMQVWHAVPGMGYDSSMSTAQRVFIAYGIVILVVGFGLGTVLGMVRMKSPAARTLATAHVETLMQAAMHFGLAFAVGAVNFDTSAATVGAWLLVAASAMQALGATTNWITNVGDQFGERSVGFYLNSSATLIALPGLAIIGYGILHRL